MVDQGLLDQVDDVKPGVGVSRRKQMVDQGLLDQVDGLVLSPRAAALREKRFTSEPRVAVEHVVTSMRSWQETGGEPLDIRRAKLFKRVTEEVPTPIFSGQKLVGSLTKSFRGTFPQPEFDGTYLEPLLAEEEGKITLGGPVEKGIITQEDLVTLKGAVAFWKGRTTVDRAHELSHEVLGSWYDDLVEAGGTRNEALPGGPYGLLWSRVTDVGMRGLREQAQAQIREWTLRRDHEVDKVNFWRAVTIACDGVAVLAHRYAQHARDLAIREQDAEGRAELLKIAEACDWVPENPPRTFREGLQAIILVYVALALESPRLYPSSLGRIDRDLYPLFKRDLDEGRLTIAEAGDLIADFLLFVDRQDQVMDLSWRDFIQKGLLCSVGLAGTDAQGRDVSNELTYLVLHVMGFLRISEPHLAIGWHKNIPDWLMRKALETNVKVGGGVPQFHNIETWIDLCSRRGIPEGEARDWISHGCSQLEPAGQATSMSSSYISIPLALELALHNGIVSKTGKRLGPETGDPRSFQNFDQLYDAFKTQAELMIRTQVWHDDLMDSVRAHHYRQPLASALLPGCIEKGCDYSLGGLTHYKMRLKKDRGLVPTADSLLAVKKLVYEERRLTMAELMDAIDSDFDGARGEEIRRMCLATPKYGNDIDEADYMLRDVAAFTGNVILSTENIWGYHNAINRNGQAWHYSAGKRLAALPNGRKAGTPLADGSLSPAQGMDRKGPTAVLNSAIKADFKQQSICGILTLMFPPALFRSDQPRDKISALIRGFFEDGGTYIQFNVMDGNMLREARKHPDRYRDLIVRVGGYSAYFVNLSPDVQEEIIARTEHSLVGV